MSATTEIVNLEVAIGRECPSKHLPVLHSRGRRRHYTCGRFPKKVICVPFGAEVPGDFEPTVTQLALDASREEAAA